MVIIEISFRTKTNTDYGFYGKQTRKRMIHPLSSQSPYLMEGPGVAPCKGGGVESEFDFPPVLYVDLPLSTSV